MSVFEKFTNMYSLQKTLRFELKPVGNTLENMKKQLGYDKDLQTFMKDQEIEDAYQLLKPLIDDIHEEFITKSLESDRAKQIVFSDYLDKYIEKSDVKGEEDYRKMIGETYEVGGKILKDNYPNLGWKKGSKVAKGCDMLMSQDILEVIRDRNKEDEKIQKALKIFNKFYTYFAGYNQNRTNYYETKSEKATAVATRIVHENLPKFCDNCLLFNGYVKKKKDGIEEKVDRMDEYLNTHNYLKIHNKITQIKDAETNKMIEAYPIEEKYFNVSYFNNCLSQKQIENYNKIMGHYNSLINLYNQARKSEEKTLKKSDKKFKSLPFFKTLYKQIGCGKQKSMFFALKYYRESDIKQEDKKDDKEIFSVEKVLKIASEAGNKYFFGKSDNGVVNTVSEFVDWLRENHSDWSGFYWSSKAINTISNKYFANWYAVIELIKMNPDSYDNVATYDRKREEQVKLRDAVELKGLFDLLDNSVDEKQEKWWEVFFKKSVWEGKEKESKLEIIKKCQTPSEALLELLFSDILDHADKFNKESEIILALEDYKTDENKKSIKKWMDNGLAVNQMLKYFLVNSGKLKGDLLNSELTNNIKNLIQGEKEEIDWFKWYDALRNYLTKKPQENVQENKLKLNFDTNNGNFLNGFVDSHTDKSDNATQYNGYLFRKYSNELADYEYYLGICKDAKLFRCYLQDSIKEDDKSEYQRLEYYQPKSSTFFSEEYSKNKERLIAYISNRVEEIAKQKSKLCCLEKDKRELESEKNKILKGDTPKKIIDNISKQRKHSHFSAILDDEKLLNLINGSINEMKSFIKNYEKRNVALKEIQNKKYIGVVGYKDIINDLQKIAKESKVYKYFTVSQKEFNEGCNRKEKPLYIFKICNKDLIKTIKTRNEEKKLIRHKNLHTLFFECLMSGSQRTFDLGSGNIFYRQKAINEKKIKDGYQKKPWIINNKRFTINEQLENNKTATSYDGKSFFLNLSMSLNYVPEGISKLDEFNNRIVDELFEEETYFLGLDRGEKHLIYYFLIDSRGDRKEQGSLNLDLKDKDGNRRCIKKIKQVYNKTKKEWESKEVACWDYNDLLDVAASNRDEARKNWQTIGNIKNLKEGYISQVIHEIVKKVTDKPMFVVLEDLNTGFKRGRQKIEKQIYQKFELALAKKLNFVVDKNIALGEIGSVTKAIQLTPLIANYQDIGKNKQVGIMLYTRANYTSQTDPVTGWRKTIYLKKGSEQNIQEQIEEKFEDIGFDGKDYYFKYTDAVGKEWTLYSGKNGEDLVRYRGKRTDDNNIWETEKISLKDKLDKIFEGFDLDRSLLSQISDEGKEIKKIDDKNSAWESLRFVIDLIQQIRNSGGDNVVEKDNNFLLSPVRDENGNHFDSRKGEDGLPKDADANGAYNIARKGIIMNEHIKQWKKDGSKKNKDKGSDLDLFVSDEEWDLWLAYQNKQKPNYKWKEMLPTFSSRKEMEKYRKKK